MALRTATVELPGGANFAGFHGDGRCWTSQPAIPIPAAPAARPTCALRIRKRRRDSGRRSARSTASPGPSPGRWRQLLVPALAAHPPHPQLLPAVAEGERRPGERDRVAEEIGVVDETRQVIGARRSIRAGEPQPDDAHRPAEPALLGDPEALDRGHPALAQVGGLVVDRHQAGGRGLKERRQVDVEHAAVAVVPAAADTLAVGEHRDAVRDLVTRRGSQQLQDQRGARRRLHPAEDVRRPAPAPGRHVVRDAVVGAGLHGAVRDEIVECAAAGIAVECERRPGRSRHRCRPMQAPRATSRRRAAGRGARRGRRRHRARWRRGRSAQARRRPPRRARSRRRPAAVGSGAPRRQTRWPSGIASAAVATRAGDVTRRSRASIVASRPGMRKAA